METNSGGAALETRDGTVGETPFLAWHDFYEIHESGAIDAKPGEIINAVSELDMRDDQFAKVMLFLRELPSTVVSMFRRKNRSTGRLPFGFHTFTLLKRDDHEISLGLIGRFWRPDLVFQEVADVSEFCSRQDPRTAKLVLRFLVLEHDGKCPTLVTETFIFCPNSRTKLLFTPYWLLIRLASGWMRRRTLASIQKQLGK